MYESKCAKKSKPIHTKQEQLVYTTTRQKIYQQKTVTTLKRKEQPTIISFEYDSWKE